MFRPTNTVALSLSLFGLGLLGACSSTTTPPVGSGGAPASGGTVGSGGASGGTSSGGTSSGGVSSGGTASGGTGTGGTGTGGVGTGGVGTGGSTGGSGGGSTGGSGGGGSGAFVLTIENVDGADNADCDAGAATTCPLFPEENVFTNIGGDNISPAMSWPAGPEGTLSYAVTLFDLSSSNSHWALWDIPAGTLELPAGIGAGASLTDPITAKQAGFTSASYTGSGMCLNVYEFKLYALDTATFDVGGATTAAAVITALEAATPLDTSFVRLQSREYCE